MTVDADEVPLWHVTVTVQGQPCDLIDVREALERLAFERPFLLAGRYAVDRAEIRYWEEARTLPDAAALAMTVWADHRRSADLPPWSVVGLEVVDQPTHTWRTAARWTRQPALAPAGDIRPF